MTASQIIIYAAAALLLLFYLRRRIQRAKMKEYSASEVLERMKDNSVVLLDVRSQEERSQKHIKGSLHVPVGELTQKLKTLEKYRQKEVICYCHSGSRSFMATLMLTQNGFQAANMKGGMIAWNSLHLK
jgi:rhodanese-related sulfurtransferase